MYEFIFKIGGNLHFRTKLESIQCKDKRKNGQQCKNKTVMGSSHCYSHLLYKHSLRIKESNLLNAGLGLFAIDAMNKDDNAIIFRKGDTIIEYAGEIIDEEELEERYADKTAPYTVAISKDVYEDAAKIRGVGALANTHPRNNNATLSVYRGKAKLKATKNIRNGEEIYLSYGKAYKLNDPDVEHYTTKA